MHQHDSSRITLISQYLRNPTPDREAESYIVGGKLLMVRMRSPDSLLEHCLPSRCLGGRYRWTSGHHGDQRVKALCLGGGLNVIVVVFIWNLGIQCHRVSTKQVVVQKHVEVSVGHVVAGGHIPVEGNDGGALLASTLQACSQCVIVKRDEVRCCIA